MFSGLFSRRRSRDGNAASIEEQQARIEKLRAETSLLTLQLMPRERFYERLKVIASIGGILTAGAALLGLFLSTFQWFRSERLNREVRVEERLERALKLIADENPTTRLAGVLTLASFLREANDAHAPQALLALTNSLGIESSLTVRNAIIATFEDADVSRDAMPNLNRAVVSLAQVSRGLVNEGDLWSTRRKNLWLLPPHDSVESRAVSVATAIAIMLRKGARAYDLTGIYLPATDLNGLSLPDIRLDDSILAWSSFKGATLTRASFKDTDLDRTVFTEANLEGADFSHTTNRPSGTRHHDYISQELASRNFVNGPDFEGANLRRASFANYPVVPIYVDGDLAPVAYKPSFRCADITNADFMSVTVFGLLPIGSASFSGPYPSPSGAFSSYAPEAKRMEVHAEILPSEPLGKIDGFGKAIWHVRYLFEGSNWQKAKMPRSMRDALTFSHPAVPRSPCRQR